MQFTIKYVMFWLSLAGETTQKDFYVPSSGIQLHSSSSSGLQVQIVFTSSHLQ